MDYRNGGLTSVDVFFKVFSQWKVIPLFFINKLLVTILNSILTKILVMMLLNISLHFTKVCSLTGRNFSR